MKPVLEITGLEGQEAYYAYNKVMLGLSMLPAYALEGYVSFFKRISDLPEADKLEIVKEAALLIDLKRPEILALCYFCQDKNGVRYTSSNLKNLSPPEITVLVISVLWEISKMDITYLTEEEKKN